MITQNDDISCGAVAIYNALLSYFITPRPSLDTLIVRLDIKANNGCYTGDLLEELVRYFAVKQDNMSNYKKECFNFIIEYELDDGDMHFAFGMNIYGKIKLFNHCAKCEFGAIIMSRKEFDKILKRKETKAYRLMNI